MHASDLEPAPTVAVRRPLPGEYDLVGDITVEAYRADGYVHGDSDYAEELRDAARRDREAEVWVAVDDGAVVGTVTFCPPGSPYRELGVDGDGELRMLAVSPAARRRGIGRLLVEQCLRRCGELGLHRLVLCSMTTMRGAHELYRQLGFVRAEHLDWEPVPGVLLLGFVRPV